jgi:hypothetical protein
MPRSERASAKPPTAPFQLAPLTELNPEAIVPKQCATAEEERFAELMLTLALFFNDVKGILLAFDQIDAETKPAKDEVSAQAGQWVGLDMQRHRLLVALMHELFGVLKAFKPEATGERMARLLKKMTPTARVHWSALFGRVGRNPSSKTKAFAAKLAQIRSNMAFHYDQPIPLLRGFRRHFYETPPHPSNEHAFCSFGRTMEETRFYYADAAVEQALWVVQGKDKPQAFLAEVREVIDQANQAIWAVLVAYLGPARRTTRS